MNDLRSSNFSNSSSLLSNRSSDSSGHSPSQKPVASFISNQRPSKGTYSNKSARPDYHTRGALSLAQSIKTVLFGHTFIVKAPSLTSGFTDDLIKTLYF